MPTLTSMTFWRGHTARMDKDHTASLKHWKAGISDYHGAIQVRTNLDGSDERCAPCSSFAEGMSDITTSSCHHSIPNTTTQGHVPAIHKRVELFGIEMYRTTITYICVWCFGAMQNDIQLENALLGARLPWQEWRQAASDVLLPQSDRILCSSGNINHCGLAEQWFAGQRLDSSAFLEPSVPSFLRVTKPASNQKWLSWFSKKVWTKNLEWNLQMPRTVNWMSVTLRARWMLANTGTTAQPLPMCHLTASNWHTRHPPVVTI